MAPLTLVVLGLAAGIGAIISAVTGMAGGMLLLATMLALSLSLPFAIQLHALVQLVANVTRLLTLWRHIRWRDALWVIVPATPGPILGVVLLELIDEQAIRIAIGLLVLYTTWAPKRKLPAPPEGAADAPPADEPTPRLPFLAAGILGGVFGVLIGAVGLLIGPAFVRTGWRREQVVATQTLCQAWLHIIKIVAIAQIGFVLTEIALPFAIMAAAAILGTVIGRQLLHRVSDRVFRILLRTVLTLLALQLLGQAIYQMISAA